MALSPKTLTVMNFSDWHVIWSCALYYRFLLYGCCCKIRIFNPVYLFLILYKSCTLVAVIILFVIQNIT